MKTIIKAILTEAAPKAIGPYSQAILLPTPHALLFISGQLPSDPETSKMVEGDITVQTQRVLENIRAILLAAGSDLQHVVRVEIFCIDLKNDFEKINAVYGAFFNHASPPARQTIQVKALPFGVPIEISCIAAVPQT